MIENIDFIKKLEIYFFETQRKNIINTHFKQENLE